MTAAAPLPEHVARDEADHRTRNMLQMVSGMFAREARGCDDAAARVLRRAEAQVAAFALLSQAVSVAERGGVDAKPCLAAYLEAVCRHLEAACLAPIDCRLVTRFAGPLPLDARGCRHLALAVTELVFNAVKHAFDEGCDALMIVATEADPATVRVAVADNGRGMTAPSPGRHRGLGFVDMLMSSVGGSCSCVTGSDGTRFLLSVPR